MRADAILQELLPKAQASNAQAQDTAATAGLVRGGNDSHGG
jgi:hypothetical protein